MNSRTVMLAILVVLAIGRIHAQTNVSGDITTSARWTLGNSPYTFTGDVRVSSGATLTIESGVTIHLNSSTLRVGSGTAGILMASGVTFNNGNIDFSLSSSGTITNSTFTATQLRFYNQSAPAITNNTFDASSSLYVYSEEVLPKLSGNTLGNQYIHLAFTVTKNATLKKYATSEYMLDGSVSVNGGATLTIESGVTIHLNSSTLRVGSGTAGILMASGVTFNNGNIDFSLSSSGTITNSTFTATQLRFYNQSAPAITNNTFDASSSLYVYSEEVLPKLSGNTLGNQYIHLAFTVTKNATLKKHATSEYMLDGSVSVNGGATLTIESGVTIHLNSSTLRVGSGTAGILMASGVTFNNGNIDFSLSSSGTITNSTFTATQLRFYNQSAPAITNNTFDASSSLYVYSEEVLPKLSGNTLGNQYIHLAFTVTKNATLKKYATSEYMLDGSVSVNGGATLTIESGVTIHLNSSTLRVGSGTAGILMASGVTFNNGNIDFSLSSSGTITNSTFTATQLRFYNQSAPAITNNTFDASSSLYVYSEEVLPKLSGNTLGNQYIHLAFTVTKNATLKKHATSEYMLDGSVSVNGGATLTIESGVTIHLNSSTLRVGSGTAGILMASGVTFNNGNIDFSLSSSGTIDLANCGNVNLSAFNHASVVIRSTNWDVLCAVSNQSSQTVVAANNYWGHASGPYHAMANPSGQGAQLSGSIVFMPFATSRVAVFFEVYPAVLLSSPSVLQGAVLTIVGNSCKPNSIVALSIVGTSISFYQTVSIGTSGTGDFAYVLQTSGATPPGQYILQCIDSARGLRSPQVPFEIRAVSNTPAISILNPSKGYTGRTGQPISVVWTDRLYQSSAYSSSGPFRSYKYLLEISTDGGSSWGHSVSNAGNGLIDQNITLSEQFVINEGALSCRARVTDFFQPGRSATSIPFAIQSAGSHVAQVELQWDYTVTNRSSRPMGVSADGTSRIYLVVSKQNPAAGPAIIGVTLQMSDGQNSEPRTLGKVMAASITDRFSNEANVANSTVVSDNTSKQSYWFWYVSPEDFAGADPQDAQNATRIVLATVTVRFADGSQETLTRNVVVSRPPLVFIHGLGSGPETWGGFSYYSAGGSVTLFLNDPRFIVTRAVRMSPQVKFQENAQRLLSLPNVDNRVDPNSFVSVIHAMWSNGFAANQVDCITHSMGGTIVRQAATYTPSFYNQINYSRGYIHKLITLDTPHAGSPVADIVAGFITDLNDLPFSVLHPIQSMLRFDCWSLLTSLYDAADLNVVTSLYSPDDGYVLKPSGALGDLKVQDGVRFGVTPLHAHLIAGDIIPGELHPGQMPPQVESLISSMKDVVALFDKLFDFLSVVGSRNLRDFLESVSHLDKVGKVVALMDYLSHLYTGFSFFAESDVFVGVNSQLSGIPRTAQNVTLFDGVSHVIVTSDLPVGNRVNHLLNEPLSSPGVFLPIPASIGLSPTKVATLASMRPNQIVGYGGARISIVAPTSRAEVFCDSTMKCRILLSDTVGLRYAKVHFQGESYTFAKASEISFEVQVGAASLDTSRVTAIAVYDYGDSTSFAQTSAEVLVRTGTPLVRLAVEPTVFTLVVGETDRPHYHAVYRNVISDISKTRGKIQAAVSDPGVIRFSTDANSFAGIGPGQASAVVSYEGQTDTLFFLVLPSSTVDVKHIDQQSTGTIPDRFGLYQNYPNPFNPSTCIRYDLPKSSFVVLNLYDVLGREVATLVREGKAAGSYEILLKAQALPSGVYFYRLQAGSYTETKKLLIVR